MELSDQTKARLDAARDVIEELRDTATDRAVLAGESEPAERDVAGASNAFLAATNLDKLTKPRKPRRAYDPKAEEGWVTLRFRITDSQRTIIHAAMDMAKEIAGVTGRLWKGVALEYVCADFIASYGMPSKAGDLESDHE